ncbi:hypothetical protein C7B62_13190 [Pleurocapsa sp. CCALA 161]|nr:hypothetical protein C7B62_13190 [Pleurocapsa sp. CCALA 161]
MNFSSQIEAVFGINTRVVKINISYRGVIELAGSHNQKGNLQNRVYGSKINRIWLKWELKS